MEELLRYICRELEERNIAYMVSGSVSMGIYTVARYTRDIDIVIELDVSQLDALAAMFATDFYFHRPSVEVEIRRQGMFNVIDQKTGFKIDFIVKKVNLFQESEFSRRQRGTIWGVDCWVIAVEDLILPKLIWIQQLFSERQADDIRNLVADNPDLDSAYVQRWVTELSLNTYMLL